MWTCAKCGHYVSEEFAEFEKSMTSDCYEVVCRDCFIQEQVDKFKKDGRVDE